MHGSFEKLSSHIGVPDDVTVGFIVSELLDRTFLSVDTFHSHLENLDAIKDLPNQVTAFPGTPLRLGVHKLGKIFLLRNRK